MKKFLYSFVILSVGLFTLPVLADQWLDIAQDLQKHIITEVPISPEDQKQIDINLAWAKQCISKQLVCSTDNEKQSIRETVKKLETLWKKYQNGDIKNPVLEYIVSKADVLRAMTQEEVPPMGPVVTDILLQIYYQDALQTYKTIQDKIIADQTGRHQTALKFLPKGVVIPAVPPSKTHQAIVIDLSDQRLYAFEDELLIYTSPITSGRK
ncbi:MAG: L,D-transpeptidase [bacterium]